MSAGNFLPGSLEGYTDLEMRARLYLPEILVEFDEYLETGKGLIDEEFEFQNVNLKDASDTLSYFILEYKDIDAEAAAYRAVHFGYALRNQVAFGTITVPLRFSSYFNSLPENASGRTVVQDTQRYFQHRPALDTVTAYFMTYLDPSHNFVHMAETVTALTLMQLDNAERDGYIDRLVESEVQRVGSEAL